MKTTQARLIKLARASLDTSLYRQNGIVMQRVTASTTPNLTDRIEVPHEGMKRTSTFESVSPTTTLYDIIAKEN